MKIPAVVFSVLSVVTVSRGDIIMSPGDVEVLVEPKCSKVVYSGMSLSSKNPRTSMIITSWCERGLPARYVLNMCR